MTTTTTTRNVMHLIRMPNSYMGNPRYRVVFGEPGSTNARQWDSLLTKPDAGGRIVRDVLAEPGVYVLVVVEVLPEDDDDEPEPAGWAVLRQVTS